jgi:endoglucanase
MSIFLRAASFGLAVLLFTASGAASILYAGVNSGTYAVMVLCFGIALTEGLVAGGEFAQQNLPGAFGTDYAFINETSIDFFLDAGANTIRVPFLLVRMPAE